MKHYICTGGCGGVSDVPGVCQAEGCSKHAMPLTECECLDNQHQQPEEDSNQKQEDLNNKS